MASTQARAGFGTVVKRGDGGAPEAFTAIAELGDISGPAIQQLLEDATHMESPDRFVEKIPTVLEAGDVTFTMHFLPDNTTQNLLRSDQLNGTKRNFQIPIAGGTKRWSFSAYVGNIGASYPLKGKMVSDVTLGITGKPTLEAVS